jgi:septum site-determining protein MinC
MELSISIKGHKEGVLIVLDEEHDWAHQMAQLETALENNRSFFSGARLAIEVGHRLLSLDDIQKLQARLAQRDVTLWAVVGESAATRAAARQLNLSAELGGSRAEAEPKTKEVAAPTPVEPRAEARVPLPEAEERGWLIRRTLRSGQKAHYPGHVIVVGDVNPGAEVIAGGDVVVWGRLQGLVHAGAMGNDGAVVCALDLSPTQLRIGGHIARAPDEKRRRRVRPEMASVVEGRIVAEPWDSKKQPKRS